jgi:hypothetical protein
MNEPMTKHYPWSSKYTAALSAGERLGKLMLAIQTTARILLCRSRDLLRDRFETDAQTRQPKQPQH